MNAPAVAERLYSVTVWRSVVNPIGIPRRWSWSRLVHELSQLLPWLGEGEHPGWSAASFRGHRRRASEVVALSALVLDLDHGAPTLEQIAQCWTSTRGLVTSTKRSTPAEPRFRVVIPLTRDVAPEEYARLWSWAHRHSAEHRIQLDEKTRDPARFWFISAEHLDGSPFIVQQLPGESLDVDALLRALPRQAPLAARHRPAGGLPRAAGGSAAPSSLLAPSRRQQAPAGQLSRGERDRRQQIAQSVLVADVSRLRGAREGERNAELYLAAQSLGRYLPDGHLSAEQVESTLTSVAAGLGLGEVETRKSILSGLRAGARSEARWPEPYALADDETPEAIAELHGGSPALAREGSTPQQQTQRVTWIVCGSDERFRELCPAHESPTTKVIHCRPEGWQFLESIITSGSMVLLLDAPELVALAQKTLSQRCEVFSR